MMGFVTTSRYKPPISPFDGTSANPGYVLYLMVRVGTAFGGYLLSAIFELIVDSFGLGMSWFLCWNVGGAYWEWSAFLMVLWSLVPRVLPSPTSAKGMVLFGMVLMETDFTPQFHGTDDNQCLHAGVLLSLWYFLLVKLDIIAFLLVDVPCAWREAQDSHPDDLRSLADDLDELLVDDAPSVCETEEELVASLTTPSRPLPSWPVTVHRTCWQSCSDTLGSLRRYLLRPKALLTALFSTLLTRVSAETSNFSHAVAYTSISHVPDISAFGPPTTLPSVHPSPFGPSPTLPSVFMPVTLTFTPDTLPWRIRRRYKRISVRMEQKLVQRQIANHIQVQVVPSVPEVPPSLPSVSALANEYDFDNAVAEFLGDLNPAIEGRRWMIAIGGAPLKWAKFSTPSDSHENRWSCRYICQ
jgi:hypothetical protein